MAKARNQSFVLLVSFLISLPALAEDKSNTIPSYSPGIPVDSRGGPTIDPTKNVLDLVLAAVKRIDDITSANTKRLDDLREADARYQNSMRTADDRRVAELREAETRRVNDLRDAETRRLDQLATNKQIFDLELARVNRSNVDASALLLATQVKELKTDSADRTGKLEQFANEQRGRASGGNEVWALLGIVTMLLLVGIGLLFNMTRKKDNTISSEAIHSIIIAAVTAEEQRRKLRDSNGNVI